MESMVARAYEIWINNLLLIRKQIIYFHYLYMYRYWDNCYHYEQICWQKKRSCHVVTVFNLHLLHLLSCIQPLVLIHSGAPNIYCIKMSFEVLNIISIKQSYVNWIPRSRIKVEVFFVLFKCFCTVIFV
jgi:hypothetical protein